MTEGTVGVLFGGRSSEHVVSIRSGCAVIRALQASGKPVLPVYESPKGLWQLGADHSPNERFSLDELRRARGVSAVRAVAHLADRAAVVFPCLHGAWGEDGTIQGFLETAGLPYVGSRVLASALCMDKARSKALVAQAFPGATLDSVTISRGQWQRDQKRCLASVATLPLPVIVKPQWGGSSVGLSKVSAAVTLQKTIARAFAVDDGRGVVVERFCDGLEFTCVVRENPTPEADGKRLCSLPIIQIISPPGRLFDYEVKYTPGLAEEICPAPISTEHATAIKTRAEQIFELLDCSGFVRLDFLDAGGPTFLECNTMPGLTEESLTPKAVRAAGIELSQFVAEQVDIAQRRFSAERRFHPKSLAAGGKP